MNSSNDPRLSLLREFWGNIYAHVILTAEADSIPTDARSCFMANAQWDAIEVEARSVSSRHN